MIYKVIQILLKLYLPLFFKSITIRGLDKVPMNKPVIFAVNHQNAFLDAILVGIYVKRPVYFLTRSDLFQGKWVLKIFNALNLVPIFRQKDGDKDFVFDATKADMQKFDKIIDEIEPGILRIPVLIKKYVKQNARLVAFNVDPKFNNAIDGLLYIKVAEIPESTVRPVMEEFQAELERKVTLLRNAK